MADDDYDLMPHKQIKELQKEVERLKKLPFGKGKSGKDLVDSVDALNSSINKLIEIFGTATKELVKQEPRSVAVKKIAKVEDHPVMGKIEELIDQNKIIAEALLAVANKVKDLKTEPKQAKKKEEVVKEPIKLQTRAVRPRFEQLEPRPRFVPPMQTPYQQGSPLPFNDVPTGAPIPPDRMAATGLKPPIPEPVPPLPELPKIERGGAPVTGEPPKKKGLFHFK